MFIEINNAPIHVSVCGNGEPALLLHGVPDSATLWDDVISGIESKHQCFAPDLPGFYRSGIPDDYAFNLDHYAEFTDQLVNKLEIKTPLTLIIHDWGGIFGMLWACKYPDKVKRIIGGSFPFSHLYQWHEWATVWRTPILGELSMLMLSWPLFKWELNRGSKGLNRAHIKSTYDHLRKQWSTRKTILKMYRSASPHLLHHWQASQRQLADKVPIDLIWGKQDPYVPTLQARVIQSRSVTLADNCGHWVPAEQPEVYIKTILEGPEDKTLDDSKIEKSSGVEAIEIN